MKINDITDRINASYNTIKKFIEKEPEYHRKISNVIHVTDEGLEALENKYGVRSEIMSETNIDFYRAQVKFLNNQLEETKKYSQTFVNMIEMKDREKEIKEEELKDKKSLLEEQDKAIKNLQKIIYQNELEKQELNYKLELEKNKGFFKRMFKRK